MLAPKAGPESAGFRRTRLLGYGAARTPDAMQRGGLVKRAKPAYTGWATFSEAAWNRATWPATASAGTGRQ